MHPLIFNALLQNTRHVATTLSMHGDSSVIRTGWKKKVTVGGI